MAYSSILIAGDRLEDVEAVVDVVAELFPRVQQSRVIMLIPRLEGVLADRQLQHLTTRESIDAIERRARDKAERALKSRAARRGIDPDRVFVSYDATASVREHIADWKSDLLILGVRGRGAGEEVEPFVQKMLQDADCDVLAVRI